jgi:hypothetical protein
MCCPKSIFLNLCDIYPSSADSIELTAEDRSLTLIRFKKQAMIHEEQMLKRQMEKNHWWQVVEVDESSSEPSSLKISGTKNELSVGKDNVISVNLS